MLSNGLSRVGRDAARLTAAVAAVAPIDGVSPIDPENRVYRIDYRDATEDQRAAGDAVLAGFDWSDAADAEYSAGLARAAAIHALLGSGDDLAVAVRGTVKDIYSQINDVREAVGLPRIMDHVIIPRIVAGLKSGTGDAMPGF